MIFKENKRNDLNTTHQHTHIHTHTHTQFIQVEFHLIQEELRGLWTKNLLFVCWYWIIILSGTASKNHNSICILFLIPILTEKYHDCYLQRHYFLCRKIKGNLQKVTKLKSEVSKFVIHKRRWFAQSSTTNSKHFIFQSQVFIFFFIFLLLFICA
jgi:hypothetical protein